MSEYSVSKIYPSDKRANKAVDLLLEEEGIRRDRNLDYTCGIYDDDMDIIATGSCFGNTLRCFAVSSRHQGEGLLNQIITHLIEVQHDRGNLHLFLYTKCSTSKFFGDLGFYEIARVDNQVVFMENRKNGFPDYLKKLKTQELETSNVSANATSGSLKNTSKIAALVMNANPFTLGHLFLVEKAAAENDVVHLFMVSEDASLIPFAVRKKLIMEGTAHLTNIQYHESGPYIISNATFPSYFQKDESAIISGHAKLDLAVFTKIAAVLGINRRYVGEEPNSQVTGIYNQIMAEELPKAGITCVIVPRKEYGGNVISASTVRQKIQSGDIDELKGLVPDATLQFFLSEAAAPLIQKIKEAGNVIHY